MPYLGEIAALSTALCWLGSSIAFAVASRAVGATATNQFRLYAALPLLCALGLAFYGGVWPAGAPWPRLLLLALSGVVGLAIGDFALFHAFGTIGPRVSTVVMALWPACTVGLNALRGVVPGAGPLAGVALTVFGVVLVLLKSREGAWRPGLDRRAWLLGLLGAFVGALGQAGGVVLGDAGMAPGADLPDGVRPLDATIVRMLAGTASMQLIVTLQGRPFALRRVFSERRALAGALFGAVFGPVFGVWLSMVAIRHADAGVAAALMATTPVFMLPVSVWLYGARVGRLAVVGTVLAVAGVALCFALRQTG